MHERKKAICIVILYVNPSELDFEIFEPYICTKLELHPRKFDLVHF